MNYDKYLQTTAWKLKRDNALISANWRCKECGDEATDVHHVTYDRLGHEEPDDLVALCIPCHMKAHGLPSITVYGNVVQWLESVRGTELESMAVKFVMRPSFNWPPNA